MSDYYATLKIQQGRLKAAMMAAGIATAAELSRQAGVSQGTIGELLNFKIPPRNKNGEWRDVVLAVCRALASEPSDVFPEHLHHEIPTNTIGSYIEAAQLSGREAPMLSPADICQENETTRVLNNALGSLTDTERTAVEEIYYRGRTQLETAKIIGRSPTRVSQIVAKALRKLRHPSRLIPLECASGFPSYWDDIDERQKIVGRPGEDKRDHDNRTRTMNNLRRWVND